MSTNWPYDTHEDPWIYRMEIEATIEEADTPEMRATARRAGRHTIKALRAANSGDHATAKAEMAETDRILPRPE